MNKSYFTKKIPTDRYALFLRGSLLITAGSLIAIFETLAAIYLGLHHVPYGQAVAIAVFVLLMNSILISITYFKKNFLVWHEWAVFGLYLLFYLTFFCIWIYRLGELRLLAIINAFTTITILLSYTNVLQSFLISMGTLTCYFAVTRYAITVSGQPGSPGKEAFFSFCLIPAFLLISSVAHYINKKRKDLEVAKYKLEKINSELAEVNNKLKKEQLLSKIEMDLAGEIQSAILPGKGPDTTDWDIALVTKPFGTVSGDFFDFYSKGNILKGLSLFDVSGHGVAPALITILAKPVLYNHFKRCEFLNLGKVLESADSDLLNELEQVNVYITGLILRMNGHEVEYANAGHPDLLHFRSSSKKVSVISDLTDAFKRHPLGISMTRQEYRSHTFKVESGDFLISYTDGFTESRNSLDEQFGLKGLSDAVLSFLGGDAAALLKHILEFHNVFTGDIKANDDFTIIIAGKI